MNNKKISQSKNQLKMLKKPVLTNKLSPDMFVVTVVDSIAHKNTLKKVKNGKTELMRFGKCN